MLWASVDQPTSLLPGEPCYVSNFYPSIHSGTVLSYPGGVQGQQNGCLPSRWTELRLPSSPVFEDVQWRRPVLLLQLQAWFVSSATEHEDSVHHPQLRTVCLSLGIMGMHVVSPVARAVSLNHFHDVSLLLTGLRFSTDSLYVFFFFF